MKPRKNLSNTLLQMAIKVESKNQMKFSSILVALVLVCLALAACNKPVEEQASAKEGNGNVAESTNEPHRKLPECAQRDKDGTYKHGSGCSAEQ